MKGLELMVMTKGEHILQEQYGTTKKAAAFYNKQMFDHLNCMMKKFISEQSMMFISTADSNGSCDSSFRAGLPGFVRIIDEKTLIYPEYKGNGVMASLGNIIENPQIGLMFIDFFENCIGLHVNGKASIVENSQLSSLNMPKHLWTDILEKGENKAERWVVIEVEETYVHCSKHIPKLKHDKKEIFWGTDDEEQKRADFFKGK
ncbi:pyridoxamine 5'-phosphate oxidase family protein [Paenibacillus sp. BSR1-1]|uniref:pyridoxamine 5'-phosphate oxidase family protein n=1 Tax=Paenibacillus sp. BSR1-1 TaxID=3020845 RepID=UPI0025B1D08B|nr:pyridoxamine 5'-phosphate oxidase family protein [Paenibacillus sp. BSR1-1]MDN3019607.1 pyridoxamine 5'-phosphate oxidase family protein [Paenibacillus sp. BSR1-1]